MSSLANVEKIICKIIKESVDIDVFNTIPEDPDLPLIRIGDVESSKWLLSADSLHAIFNITLYADSNSNIFLFETIGKLHDNLSTKNFQEIDPSIKYVCISDATIRQMQEDMSIAEMRLEVKSLSGEAQ